MNGSDFGCSCRRGGKIRRCPRKMPGKPVVVVLYCTRISSRSRPRFRCACVAHSCFPVSFVFGYCDCPYPPAPVSERLWPPISPPCRQSRYRHNPVSSNATCACGVHPFSGFLYIRDSGLKISPSLFRQLQPRIVVTNYCSALRGTTGLSTRTSPSAILCLQQPSRLVLCCVHAGRVL